MLKNTAAVIKHLNHHMGMGQNLVPLVNIKIAGKWMFISLNMVLIGIDPYPHLNHPESSCQAWKQSPRFFNQEHHVPDQVTA
jgi:hypothetical protein